MTVTFYPPSSPKELNWFSEALESFPLEWTFLLDGMKSSLGGQMAGNFTRFLKNLHDTIKYKLSLVVASICRSKLGSKEANM